MDVTVPGFVASTRGEIRRGASREAAEMTLAQPTNLFDILHTNIPSAFQPLVHIHGLGFQMSTQHPRRYLAMMENIIGQVEADVPASGAVMRDGQRRYIARTIRGEMARVRITMGPRPTRRILFPQAGGGAAAGAGPGAGPGAGVNPGGHGGGAGPGADMIVDPIAAAAARPLHARHRDERDRPRPHDRLARAAAGAADARAARALAPMAAALRYVDDLAGRDPQVPLGARPGGHRGPDGAPARPDLAREADPVAAAVRQVAAMGSDESDQSAASRARLQRRPAGGRGGRPARSQDEPPGSPPQPMSP